MNPRKRGARAEKGGGQEGRAAGRGKRSPRRETTGPSPYGEDALKREAAGLESLATACIDASSIIIMEKAGYLGLAVRALRLVTIPPVAREANGVLSPGIAVVESGAASRAAPSNDAALVAEAADRRLAVISEDRKVLLAAQEHGLPYYNALMVLCLLLVRGLIGADGYDRFRDRLVGVARYAPRVLAYGDALAAWLVKNG